MDPEEDARTSPFAHLCVAQSTAALWGRRIVSVTTSDSAAFAVSALGEVLYCKDVSSFYANAMFLLGVDEAIAGNLG